MEYGSVVGPGGTLISTLTPRIYPPADPPPELREWSPQKTIGIIPVDRRNRRKTAKRIRPVRINLDPVNRRQLELLDRLNAYTPRALWVES